MALNISSVTEWAISDTARLGYQAALKGELLKKRKKINTHHVAENQN